MSDQVTVDDVLVRAVANVHYDVVVVEVLGQEMVCRRQAGGMWHSTNYSEDEQDAALRRRVSTEVLERAYQQYQEELSDADSPDRV